MENIGKTQINYLYYSNYWIKPHFKVLIPSPVSVIQSFYQYYIKKLNPINRSKLSWSNPPFHEPGFDFDQSARQSLSWQNIKDISSETAQTTYKNNVFILENIIAWAVSKNINVILYTLPAHSSYRKNLHPLQLKSTEIAVNTIADKYENTIYLNFMSDPQFIDSDFWNASHLSKTGADKFSCIMDSVVQNLNLKEL